MQDGVISAVGPVDGGCVGMTGKQVLEVKRFCPFLVNISESRVLEQPVSLAYISRHGLQTHHQRTAKLKPLQLMHLLPICQHKLGEEGPEDVVRLDVGVVLDRHDEVFQLFVELCLDIVYIVCRLQFLLDLDEVLGVSSSFCGQESEVFVLVPARRPQVVEEGNLIVEPDHVAVDGLIIEDGVILNLFEEVAGLEGQLSEQQRVALLGVRYEA